MKADSKQRKANKLLWEAVSTGSYKNYQDAIRRGADIHVIDEDDGGSLLLSAVFVIASDIVKDLLARGLDVNHISDGGWTPLHEAARGSSLEVVQLLVEAGANINQKDARGQTPLHLSVKYGKSDVIEMLLKVGADPFTVDLEGRSPLDLLNPEHPKHAGALLALAPVFASISRDELSRTVRSVEEKTRSNGACSYCGRQAHAGRCRL